MWRYFRYVYNADIVEIYQHIWLDSKHTPFQRILFRNSKGHIRDFEWSSNPATAGEENAAQPSKSKQRHSQLYVCRRCPFGICLRRERSTYCSRARSALDYAGFPLRKWDSNHKEIIAHIQSDHLLNTDFLQSDTESTEKTLPPVFSTEISYAKSQVLSKIANCLNQQAGLLRG